MKRGEIYFAALDPTRGAEIKKMRPAIVVSNDAANRGGIGANAPQLIRIAVFDRLRRQHVRCGTELSHLFCGELPDLTFRINHG